MPRSVRRFYASGALVALALASTFQGTAHAAPPSYGDTTDVVSVEVPVQVVKDGAPVRGLKVDDFEIFDGRKKQAITGFEVLDATSAPAEPVEPATGAPVQVAARRHFLLLFDLAFSQPKAIVQARRAVRDLVDKRLRPTDLVAVATFEVKGMNLVLGFTSDRRQIDLAVDTLGIHELVGRNSDLLRLVAAGLTEQGNVTGGGGKNLDAAVERAGELASIAQTADRAILTSDVIAMSRSYIDLARLLASVQGRKQVIYLSEGFDSSLLSGTASPREQQAYNGMVENAGANLVNLNSDQMYGNTRTGNVVERMLDELRRADCVIQAVDIGGLRNARDLNPDRPSGQDGLFLMANDTGGELYRNFNDLGEAMAQMLDRTSVTYVLNFQPEGLKHDGAYRKLRVELKNPRGARVVARPGYFAPKPFAQQNALERVFAAGNTILGGPQASAFRLSVLAPPFKPTAADAKGYVPVLLEVDGRGLLRGVADGSMPTEIYAYAIDSKGEVADYFSQIVGLDVAKVKPSLEKSGVKFFGHLDLPSGSYTLRVLVRNGRTGLASFQAMSLSVPAYASTQALLLPPLFPEPAGKWLLVREAPRGNLGGQAAQGAPKEVPYPFLVKDEPYVPASLPSLQPEETARLSLVGYNLGSGELVATAAVQGADGKAAATGDLQLVGREGGGTQGPDRLLATFKPGKLAPGEYRLTVTVTDPRGRSEATTTPFLVAAKR